MPQITVEKVARRHYIVGNTYPIKDRLKAAGCKWDNERKQWWTAKAEVAAQIASIEIADAQPKRDETVDLDAAVVRGRALYKGKPYYVLAESRDRAQDHNHDYDHSAKLCFRDGSRVFWAKTSNGLQIVARYERAKSINDLRAYAERRRAEQNGTRECPTCAKYCTCNTGFCVHHHDGCDRCGAER